MNNIYEVTYEAALAELQLENDRLKAHIERLREALIYAKGALDNYPIDDDEEKIIDGVLMETPTQSLERSEKESEASLNHIKVQVEEETILRCINFIKSNSDYDIHTTAMNCAASELGNMTRRYKEQSDED